MKNILIVSTYLFSALTFSAFAFDYPTNEASEATYDYDELKDLVITTLNTLPRNIGIVGGILRGGKVYDIQIEAIDPAGFVHVLLPSEVFSDHYKLKRGDSIEMICPEESSSCSYCVLSASLDENPAYVKAVLTNSMVCIGDDTFIFLSYPRGGTMGTFYGLSIDKKNRSIDGLISADSFNGLIRPGDILFSLRDLKFFVISIANQYTQRGEKEFFKVTLGIIDDPS